MFRLMTSKTKDKWRCPTCMKLEAKRDTPSPLTSQRRTDPQPTNSTVTPLDDASEIESNKYITKEERDKVTVRKNAINICTENSFQTLSDEEVLSSSSINLEESNLNRSCPERKLNTKYDVEEKNKIISTLENKLGSAEQEIDNLLLENSALKKIIMKYEQKVRCLDEICKSPSTSTKKNKNRLSKSAALTSTPKPCVKPINDEGLNALESPPRTEITLNNDKDIENTPKIPNCMEYNGAIQQKPHRTQIIEDSTRHNILLLADETGRHLRGRLQRILGNKYHVTATIKPNATLEQIVLSSLSDGEKFTKNDYVIILAGSHDDNIIKFQSALYNCISALKNTNVIYGEINRNKNINKFKLNKLIETISLHMENLHFSKLSFYSNSQLDRSNSCRWLVLDIMLLDYTIPIHSTTNKNSSKDVKSISTQTDVFFRDY